MRGIMSDPSQRKKRELYSGPPCTHYPHKFRTEAAHRARLDSRLRNHRRNMKSSLTYRLRALLRTVKQRCSDPRHTTYRWYGGKGIRNFLTLKQLRIMWERDGAAKMKRPSIDRESATDNYEFSKCCFRELYDNQKRGWEKKVERTAAIRAAMIEVRDRNRRVVRPDRQAEVA